MFFRHLISMSPSPFALILQASQALNLCAATIEFSGSTEQAEGERLLLLASKTCIIIVSFFLVSVRVDTSDVPNRLHYVLNQTEFMFSNSFYYCVQS